MHDTSQKNCILLQNLCSYNHLSADDNVAAGTKLFLKPQPEVAINNNKPIPPVITERGFGETQLHEVQPKEGFYSISKKYGVTISQIKKWNHLNDDNIKVGQQLIISK